MDHHIGHTTRRDTRIDHYSPGIPSCSARTHSRRVLQRMRLRYPAHPLHSSRLSSLECFQSPSHRCHPWPRRTFLDTAPPRHCLPALILHHHYRKPHWCLRPCFRNLKSRSRNNTPAGQPPCHDLMTNTLLNYIVSTLIFASTYEFSAPTT